MRQLKHRLVKENEIEGFEKSIIQKRRTHFISVDNREWNALIWIYSEDNKRWGTSIIEHDHKDQFTGLLDKNGKEIYENDIITIGDKESREKRTVKELVIFDFGCFGIDASWVDKSKYSSFIELNKWKNEVFDCIEIIGNIHENPELLENKL